jgi:hypothetical protein
MTDFPEILPSSTTPAAEPYRVRLQAVPDLLEKAEHLVRDHVLLDGCRIVMNASGDGFWYLLADAETSAGGEPPLALFQRHPSSSFTSPIH